jgi:chemotaxis methyl-accepting protein methylase
MREIMSSNNEYSERTGLVPTVDYSDPAHHSIGSSGSEITSPLVFDSLPQVTLPGVQESLLHTVVEGTRVYTANDFYRNNHQHVAALGGIIAPAIAADLPAGEPFTVLDAGCSQGKDTWSLASVLAHYQVPFKIDGIDANSFMIENATQPYQATQARLLDYVKDWRFIPPDVTRFFEEAAQPGYIRPVQALRDRVAFHLANLSEPLATPHDAYDAAMCNHMLMYYNDYGLGPNPKVERILNNIVDKLKPGGIFTYVGEWATGPWVEQTLRNVGLEPATNDYGVSAYTWDRIRMFSKIA